MANGDASNTPAPSPLEALTTAILDLRAHAENHGRMLAHLAPDQGQVVLLYSDEMRVKQTEVLALCDLAERAAQALAGCVAALERYGTHRAHCGPAAFATSRRDANAEGCTCGFGSSLAAGRAALSGG